MASIGKIRAPDRSLEKYIAHEAEAMHAVEEHHRPGRVAGTFQNREFERPDRDLVALLQPAVRREGTRFIAISRTRFLQLVEQEGIFRVRTFDLDLEPVSQFRRSTRMIDMAVGEKDLLDRYLRLLSSLEDPVDVSAGIDHGADTGVGVPDQRAILLKRRDRNDHDFGTCHGRRA